MYTTDIETKVNFFLTDESDSLDSALHLINSKAVKTCILDSDTITVTMVEGFEHYLTFYIQKQRCPKYYPVFLEIVQNTLIQNGGIEEE